MKYKLIKILFIFLILFQVLVFSKSKFTSIYINSQKFIAEIADTPELTSRGMMYRESISKNFAMLFIFDKENPQGFWMKNTLVHLDIIYLNKHKEIVNIHHNVPPCKSPPCQSYYSVKPSKYVVEIQGGLSKKMKLKKGDTIEFLL